jgi:hypothetical protein
VTTRQQRTSALGRCFAALLLLVSSPACSAESPWVPITGAVADVAGTYILTSVDGARLPVDVGTGSAAYSILYSSITLGADGTWNETRKELAPNARTVQESGVWSQQGFSVRLRGASADRYAGSVTNDGLRLSDAVLSYVFSR